MARLLAVMMILTLLVGHGMAYAAAVCQHHNSQGHALARQSQEPGVAASALAEEAAAADAAKAGTQVSSGRFTWVADMLPSTFLSQPLRVLEPMSRRIVEVTALHGRSVLPLLEPPTD